MLCLPHSEIYHNVSDFELTYADVSDGGQLYVKQHTYKIEDHLTVNEYRSIKIIAQIGSADQII